jgi:Fic family protein
VEPLLPTQPAPELDELAEEICRRGFELKRLLHPVTEARIAAALRSANSYYSNRIHWKDTSVLELESGLRKRLENEPGTHLQRLALAHIDTHEEMESWLAAQPHLQVFGATFLCRLHRSFYSRLTREDRLMRDGDELVPGELRKEHVRVGRHQAPDWRSLPALLAHAERVYGSVREPGRRLIAIACAHHRLAWLHPFRDGSGRVLRLQSQAALLQHGAGSGLWSVARGFALDVQAYRDRLADADDLADAGLVTFARYFLQTCLEQIGSMGQMLDLATLRDRVLAYLVFLGETGERIALEAEPALHQVFLAGRMPRDEFKRTTGLPARAAYKTLSALLRHGLLESEAPTGALRFGVPGDALDFYFPRLYLAAK